jgi:hypothetical protein
MDSGFNPFGSWEEFSSIINRKGVAYKSLVGQSKFDDYAESDWTPVLTFGGTAATANTVGTCTKIGRIVFAFANVAITAMGAGSGQAKITGLPFTARATLANNGAGGHAIIWSSLVSTLAFFVVGVDQGAKTATLRGGTAGAANSAVLTHADFQNGSTFAVMMTYHT